MFCSLTAVTTNPDHIWSGFLLFKKVWYNIDYIKVNIKSEKLKSCEVIGQERIE